MTVSEAEQDAIFIVCLMIVLCNGVFRMMNIVLGETLSSWKAQLAITIVFVVLPFNTSLAILYECWSCKWCISSHSYRPNTIPPAKQYWHLDVILYAWISLLRYYNISYRVNINTS